MATAQQQLKPTMWNSQSADIDECAMRTDNCSAHATCNNTKGSFNCTCKPGFLGDGRNCTGNNYITRVLLQIPRLIFFD